MTDYAGRRRRLLEDVTTDAFVAVNIEGSDPVSLRYLTGYTGEGALVVSPSHQVLLTDSRYTAQAHGETDGIAIEEGRGWTTKGLFDALTARSLKSVTLASSRVSLHWYEEFTKLGSLRTDCQRDPVGLLRRVKSPEELALIRTAVKMAEDALEKLVPWIKVGMSEADIALELELLIRRSGAEGLAFGMNVSAGPNTALNHYSPFHQPATIKAGDLLLFDFGASVHGYRSDITRTFVVGDAPAKAREIYKAVLEANCLAIEAVRSGMTGVAVDAVAREVIRNAGFGDNFGHGLGHGLGMETHESPGLSPVSKDTLVAGMVTTIEPGIYIDGFGGVRIEDDVIVTTSGCEVITSSPKQELISVG
jgi:Xaa-Pro aminopeptidase